MTCRTTEVMVRNMSRELIGHEQAIDRCRGSRIAPAQLTGIWAPCATSEEGSTTPEPERTAGVAE
jgi:hypothetical protein